MKKITNLLLVAIIAMVAVVTSVSADTVDCTSGSPKAKVGSTCYGKLSEAISI